MTATTWPASPKRRSRWTRFPILKAAKKAAPDLTFYAAYNDTFNGQKSIELKGKTKTGKIKEIEVSLDGKVLGEE